jgi:hypothetical protein
LKIFLYFHRIKMNIHEQILLTATINYDNTKIILKEYGRTYTTKLLISHLVLNYGLMKKDRQIFLKGYNEVMKQMNEMMNSDIDFNEVEFREININDNSEVTDYKNEHAYLEFCNTLKDDFKNINNVKEVADRINYFKN